MYEVFNILGSQGIGARKAGLGWKGMASVLAVGCSVWQETAGAGKGVLPVHFAAHRNSLSRAL